MNRPILPTDLNRTKRAESLRKMSLEKVKPLVQPFNSCSQVALKQIVEQVLKYFIDIIQVLLLEENSNHYLEFMKKSQEMNRQLEKKMEMLVQQKYEQLRNLFSKQDIYPKVDKVDRVDRNALLKKERKQVTKSIINFHRSNSYGGQLKSAQFLFEVPSTKTAIKQFGSVEQDFFQEKEMKTSMELNSISSQLTELQRLQNNNVQELRKNLQAKIQHNFRDIEKLNQKHIEFKLKFEQKLQENLSALWNVISDIKSSVFMLQNQDENQR